MTSLRTLFELPNAQKNNIGQISDTQAMEVLIAALNDVNSSERQAAIESLSQIGVAATGPLLTVLRTSRILRLNLAAYSVLQSIPSVTIPENETDELIKLVVTELRSLYSRSTFEDAFRRYRDKTYTRTPSNQDSNCGSPRSIAFPCDVMEEDIGVKQISDTDWNSIEDLISLIPSSLFDPILALIPSQDLHDFIQKRK